MNLAQITWPKFCFILSCFYRGQNNYERGQNNYERGQNYVAKPIEAKINHVLIIAFPTAGKKSGQNERGQKILTKAK